MSQERPLSSQLASSVGITWHSGDIILGQYEVLGVLGAGGMGTVYKVHHRGWNVDLAVKSPRPDIFIQAGGEENFRREAETWVNLGLHPHVVSCFYVRTVDEIPRVFAEYVAGGSLSDWIRTRKLYEGGHEKALERILDVAIQFAWGLHYAHEERLVHQDIKPANVMMTLDGIAKVSDFGLAQARMMTREASTYDHPGQSAVVPGMGLMSRAYASPEQMRQQPLTRKTDIWSWGASILELFAGDRFWEWGPLAAHSLEAYLESRSEDEDLPRMPGEVMTLLRQCFQEAPVDRPATMLEIAAALQEIYAREIGVPFRREMPRSVELLADNLNNRALSLFDLGKVEEAKQTWQQALQADPHHLETTYNQGLVLWRAGEMTDDALVLQLEELETTQEARGQVLYLQAEVHLERGDEEAAEAPLEEAAQKAREETEVQVLLRQVQSENSSTRRGLRIFQGHAQVVESVSLSTDGHLALSGSCDQTLRLWEVATGRCLRPFQGHTDWVTSVSLSADGRFALSGSDDRTVRLWKMPGERYLCPLRPSHIRSYAETSQVEIQAAALLLQAEHAYRATEVVTALSLVRQVRDLPGWKHSPKSIEMWRRLSLTCSRVDLHSGWLARTFQGHTQVVKSVSLSADGRLALSGSFDKTVRLWEVATGHCLRIFQGHTNSVTSVNLSADGRLALSGSDDLFGSDDGTLRLWEVATGRCLRTFQGHTHVVESVSLSADGHLALSGSRDQTVRLWVLDWELEARDPVDWDEGALSMLETFLTSHTPYAGLLPQDREPSEREIQQALTRRGLPSWSGQDFWELIQCLQRSGYGWLRPEGVHRRLEQMAKEWQGPPPLTGEGRSNSL